MSDGTPEIRELVLGFVALTDAAPLIVAREKGMFRRHGLSVQLSREASWASIRDKVALGMLDAAQMLAPMPIAASLGLGPLAVPTVAPMTLDLNGNAITVSAGLFAGMAAAEPGWSERRPRRATALARLLARGHRRPVLAVVHPFSTHNYQLRCWLAEGGVDPERDVDLVVIPPDQMVERLEQGSIDGFCVGEPWNQVAVRCGVGCLVITSHEIWPGATEKVLGVTASWAERYPRTLAALGARPGRRLRLGRPAREPAGGGPAPGPRALCRGTDRGDRLSLARPGAGAGRHAAAGAARCPRVLSRCCQPAAGEPCAALRTRDAPLGPA